MAHTGRRCGDILQLDGSGDVESTSSPSQDFEHTGGQAVLGDFVMLQGLPDAKLNKGTGFVVEHLPSGRLRVKLGQRSLSL